MQSNVKTLLGTELDFNLYKHKPLQSLAPNTQDQGQRTLMGHFYGMM